MKQSMGKAIGTGILVMLLALVGCGKNELIVDSAGSQGASGVTAYFPLNSGYTTRFQVTNSNGSNWVDNYTIGNSVFIQNGFATVRTKQTNGSVDTGYFSATSTAIYYYTASGAQGEKILEMPLTVGHSWERFASSVDTGGTNPDTTGGGGNGGGGGGGASSPTFPTTGSNIMTVTNVQTITLGNGMVFSGAIQVCTAGPNGTQNQYWFAPGVGLVKYTLAASGFLSTAEGDVTGELLDYWH